MRTVVVGGATGAVTADDIPDRSGKRQVLRASIVKGFLALDGIAVAPPLPSSLPWRACCRCAARCEVRHSLDSRESFR